MGDSGTPSAFTKPDVGRGWLHALTIYRIEHGHTRRELTTGADVFDITTHDAEHCMICSPLVGPLFTRPPLPPCTCRYGLFYVAGAVPTHALDPYANGWRRGVYAFHINELCTHHGIPALEPDEYDDLYPDGGVWGFADVLDEDERRGH